jgi:hypothetical protein
VIPIEANTASKRDGELRIPVPDQVGEPARCLFQSAGEIAGELGGPLARRVPGNPEQVHAPGVEFDDERHVQAGERECAVDVEEVGGQDRGGVGTQENSPGSVASRWRRDAVGAQDLADG